MKAENLIQNYIKKLTLGGAFLILMASILLIRCSKEEGSVATEENLTLDKNLSGKSYTGEQNEEISLAGGKTGFITMSKTSTNDPYGAYNKITPGANDYKYFKIEWKDRGFVGGAGWKTTSESRVINYKVIKKSGSCDFIGVYGWVKTPLVEYYITEDGQADWGQYDSGNEGFKKNTVKADGHTYTFYKHYQRDKPSIQGTTSFWQYIDNWGGKKFSDGNVTGKITMKTHVDNWKANTQENGYNSGWGKDKDYQVFGVETYGRKTGSIEFQVWD
jgi:endo-1,4-beta-xylanase